MAFNLERSIPFIFGFAVLLLAVVGGATYRSLMNTREALNWETHTREVLLHLEKMHSSLLETETSTRGFVVIGGDDFIQSFNNAASRFRSQVQQIKTLTADDATQQERLAKIQQLGEEKIGVSQKFIDLRRTLGPEQALAELKLGEGKSAMDRLRPLLGDFQELESSLLDARKEDLQSRLHRTLIIILSSSTLGILSLAIANFVIVRQLARRRIAETALAHANALLEERVEKQAEDLSKTSDELRLENIRRALAEKKEREQREWWRVTLNSIGDCVITTDTEGKINYINQMAQGVTGWRLEDAMEEPLEKVFNIVNEHTLQPVESPITKVLREGLTVGLANHTSLITKDGRYLPIDDSGAPIRDDQGNIIGAVLVFRDFTQQRQAESKLRRSEELQRLALEAGKMGVFAWNPHTDQLETDSRMRNLFGKTDDEAVDTAKPFFAVINPEDRPALDQNIKDAIEKKTPYDARFRVTLPDGKKRWIAGIGRVETNAQGNTTLLRGISYDITDQVEAEEKLRREEQHLRDVINSLFSFVGVMLPDGTLIEANKTALDAASLKSSDVLGKHFADTYWWNYAPEVQAQLRQAIERALQGERIRYDTTVRLSENQFIPIDFMLAPLVDDKGQVTHLIPSGLDLTPRREAEEKLRESEERYRLVAENASDVIITIDDAGTILYLNRAAERVLGYNLDEMIGQPLTQFMPEYAQHLRKAEGAMAGAGDHQLSWKHIDILGLHRTGHEVPLELSFSESRLRGKQVFIGIARDVSERRQAELKIRESEQFNRSIFENSPDCVKILELDGSLHSMNSNGLCLMEIDDFSTYVGHPWADFWPEEYQSLARNAIQTAAQGGSASFQGFCVTAKGTPKWWDVSVAPILNAEGRPVRLVSTSRDITDRKAQEEALRVNEIRFRTLTETIPQLVWTCRPDGYCGYLSNRWMEYTGTTLEQNLGAGWLQALHPDDVARTAAVWEDAVANSNTYQTEFRLRRADGAYRWHLARAVRVSDEDGNTVKWFGTCTDIEDHKRAEVERQELLEREQVLRSRAEESNRLKDEFVATISHELRTPLNAILGWARMMRAGTLDATTARKAVDVIERSAENQARLIDDLLDMSRIITGKLRLDLKTLDPAAFIRAALETVMPTAKAKEISIQTDFDPQVNAVAGDANRLQQVVWNLLSNAIKFTPKGGQITVRLTRDASQLVFSVRDTGQGIDPEFLPYVFDRFRQADASSIRKHGGLGLGLSIARHLVELHGGVITVESKGLNQGATFTVRLPILPVQLSDETNETDADINIKLPAPNAEALLSGLFILAVDDEPDARQLLAQILTAYGATVTTTDSADSAVEILKQQKMDLLVSDIGMPNNDGYTLIRRVREFEEGQLNKLPAIALTAYARPRDRMQALAAGFNHHVPKPVEPAELVTVIASLTGRLALNDVEE